MTLSTHSPMDLDDTADRDPAPDRSAGGRLVAADGRALDPAPDRSAGGRLVAADGRALALEAAHLSCDAAGGIARAVLEQRFRNAHDVPLEVTYLLPLPADGAVSGFAFRIGETRVVGEVDRRRRARERFEEAIAAGKTAALIDQERADVFTQRVGNIPPGAEIACEVIIDQRLRWLPEGAWEWRFPTVVGPRYQGAPGRVRDADRLEVAVADGPLPPRMTLALAVRDDLPGPGPESPSHPLRAVHRAGAYEVCFAADARVRLDRDVVVRWRVAAPRVGLSLDLARPSGEAHAGATYGLLTVVPPRPGGDGDASAAAEPMPRDLIFLIDTSGSMGGRPLDQAGRVVCAMIDTLGDRDRLELIEFGSHPRRWRPEPAVATRDGKREAIKWVRALRASGATEMHAAVLEALRPLRPGCQRQVVLITDGYIGFEHEILAAITAHLPDGCRLHTLGVGSAPNRSLLVPAARAGGGVELIVGLDEDVERAAARLLARTTAPLVTDMRIGGPGVRDVAPMRLPDLFAGAPALISVALAPCSEGGGGEIRVTGTTASGPFEQVIEARSLALGEGNQAVAALHARERVEDAEARIAAGGDRDALDAEIEELGLGFQIATRLTSWVAITERATVDPGGRRLAETVAHEQPYGTQIEGFGLRHAVASMPMQGMPQLAAPGAVRLGMATPAEARRYRAPAAPRAVGGSERGEDATGRHALPHPAPAPAAFKTSIASDMKARAAAGRPISAQPAMLPERRRSRAPAVALLVLLAVLAAIAFGLWRWPGGASAPTPAPARPAPASSSGDPAPAPSPTTPEPAQPAR